MKKEPLVSVILPVYNECRFLQKAIESIIDQSYPNIEIIVVNDGSTNPEVEKICLQYIDKILYLTKENGGVASALNCAINVAKGEYIARMDGDDIAYPERICKQVTFLEDNQEIDICGTNYDYIDEDDIVISSVSLPLTDSEIKVGNLFQNSLGHPSIMFRRTVFEGGLRYDENAKAEDYELWLRLEERVKFVNLKECLIGYRFNEAAVTKTHWEEMGMSASLIVKNHLNRLTDNAFANMNKYNFGNMSYICKHIEDMLSFLQEQIYIYSTILKWNEDSQYYNAALLYKAIDERWKDCLTISGMKNFLIRKNKEVFLDIQYFIDDQSVYERFYEIVSGVIKEQLDAIKAEKRYLIYSIGTRGQAVYNELAALKEQQKIQWEMAGFGDKKKKTTELFSHPVYSINEVKEVAFDYLIIATNKYFGEIEKELIDRGILQDKILDSNWIQWIKMYMK